MTKAFISFSATRNFFNFKNQSKIDKVIELIEGLILSDPFGAKFRRDDVIPAHAR